MENLLMMKITMKWMDCIFLLFQICNCIYLICSKHIDQF